MGTWGVGTFENDAAVDWIYYVAEDGSAATVRSALSTVADSEGHIDSDRCCEALAACEIVAAARGLAPSAPENPRIAESVPQLAAFASDATGKVQLIAGRMAELADDVGLALRAIAAVLDPERSELHGLSVESSFLREWLGAVEELRGRLDVTV